MFTVKKGKYSLIKQSHLNNYVMYVQSGKYS